jgi:hypothetical protein
VAQVYEEYLLTVDSKLVFSKGPNRVGVSLHLRTERNPVSDTLCFSCNYLESGRRTKSENPLIL